MLGDLLQLNPVLSHTLLEAFLEGTDIAVPRVPEKTSDVDKRVLPEFPRVFLISCSVQIGPLICAQRPVGAVAGDKAALRRAFCAGGVGEVYQGQDSVW